jgi:hypothetical protein
MILQKQQLNNCKNLNYRRRACQLCNLYSGDTFAVVTLAARIQHGQCATGNMAVYADK